ncbi:MAG: HAD family hydrolase, partial [Phycisphaerae bacterium]|nr:HAD family hydrolase [Phycisphaerae bacterium]
RVIRSISAHTLPQLAEALTRPVLSTGRLFPNALPTLEALRELRFKIALVSNTPWGTPEYLWMQQVERLGLSPFLDVQLFSSAVGWSKPDARIFGLALERLGCRPDEAIFIGDDYSADIQGAKAAGLTAIWIDRKGEEPPDEARHADRVITSLRELLPTH